MTTADLSAPLLAPATLEEEPFVVRQLRLDDLVAVVTIDAAATGWERRQFYATKIRRAVEDSSVQLSLAAEVDGTVVGYLLVAFYYGEFGVPETVAVIEAVNVHPDYRGKGIGRRLLGQLETHLAALRVERIRTEVDWQQHELLDFLAGCGFRPAPRLCLEKAVG